MEKIEAGIAKAVAGLSTGPDAFQTVAASIMTTDTRPKIVSLRQTIAGREVTLLGIAKGAAMIGPRMATMLGFLADRRSTLGQRPSGYPRPMPSSTRSIACRSKGTPAPTTRSSCSRARPRPSRSCRATTSRLLPRMVRSTCETLARAIADDGEGATHFITIDVEGCETFDDARAIARAVADSPLVKTAIHGADPNWGRIVSAAGYSGVAFEEEQLSLWINDVAVYQNGMPVPFDAAGLSQSIKSQRDVHLRLVLEFRDRSRPILDVRPDGGIHPAQCGLHDLKLSATLASGRSFTVKHPDDVAMPARFYTTTRHRARTAADWSRAPE